MEDSSMKMLSTRLLAPIIQRPNKILSFIQLRSLVHYDNIKKPDKISEAERLISWDTNTPVKLRMDETVQGFNLSIH